LTNHAYLKGQSLADKFHEVYRNNSWFDKGVSNNASYQYVTNSNFSDGANITVTPKAMLSNGARVSIESCGNRKNIEIAYPSF
jgi:hypothetical protein